MNNLFVDLKVGEYYRCHKNSFVILYENKLLEMSSALYIYIGIFLL